MNTTNVTNNNYAAYEAATKANANNKSAEVKKAGNYGKTVGEPKLSEKAAKYYESLKQKFGDLDFVLVSDKMKDVAEKNAAQYANKNKPVVLINESKIEEMANDENVRNKYEGILANAKTQMSSFASQIAGTGAEVQGYGLKIDDNGTAKYFAVLKDSANAQKARIEKHVEEKRAQKKEDAKKAAKEAEKERLEKGHEKIKDASENTVTFEANSIEELIQKISDYTFTQKADTVQTEAELSVGQHIDFKG